MVLILSPDPARLALAFLVFVSAALSDLWDGYLARKHGWITDAGKLLDPVADKLLTVSTLVPFYVVSHRPGAVNEIPWWGALPLWVLAVIFGARSSVTFFRGWALRRGSVPLRGAFRQDQGLHPERLLRIAPSLVPCLSGSLRRGAGRGRRAGSSGAGSTRPSRRSR